MKGGVTWQRKSSCSLQRAVQESASVMRGFHFNKGFFFYFFRAKRGQLTSRLPVSLRKFTVVDLYLTILCKAAGLQPRTANSVLFFLKSSKCGKKKTVENIVVTHLFICQHCPVFSFFLFYDYYRENSTPQKSLMSLS